MNTNLVVVAMCALSLGATCWLVTSMPKGVDARVAELEKKLEAAEKRADAVEALQAQMREMSERVERRVSDVDRRITSARTPPAPDDPRAVPDARAAAADASTKPIDELIAERVEKKVAEKLEAMAGRDRERGEDGKWKAPLDDLAAELKLTDAQKAQAKKVFDHARDETFTLLKTQRLDGGSLLDDYAAALKSGADPTESTKQLFGRIFSEKVPGTDRTYFVEAVSIHQDVEDQLGRQLDAGQMKRLKSLHVDLLDVRTGYDPVGDYVRAKVQ
jgi:hypothetical protein